MLPIIMGEKIVPMLETISMEAIASPVAIYIGSVLSSKK